MRKGIVSLAFIMILTSIIPWVSYGERKYDEKLEQVILKAKELFDISDGYDKFNSSIDSYDGNTSFNLEWRDTKEELKSINVIMDIDGNVISFYSYSNDFKGENKLPKYSKEQAEDIAMKFIKKISSDIKSIKLIDDKNLDNLNYENYDFQYVRYVNEIEYRENNIKIDVNKYTGEVTGYFVNWDRDIDFPSPNNIIKQNKAKELFKEKVGLKPVYRTKNQYYGDIGDNDENKYYIAYRILDSNNGIDAFTGEKININQYRTYFDNQIDEKGVSAGRITPKEQESIDQLKNIINGEKAEEKARHILGLEDNYKLQNQNLYPNYKNSKDYIWDMYFINLANEKDNYKSYISVEIDAKNGELLSFYKTVNHNDNDRNTVNKDEALKITEDYLDKQNPGINDKIELMEGIDYYAQANVEPKIYDFEFMRRENGIYVEDDTILIRVDAVSGEIISYSMNWYKGEFPSNEGMISIESAYDILWEDIGIELMYIKMPGISPNLEIQASKNMIMKLVYSVNPERLVNIDGITGEILDYSGKPYIEIKPIKYNDIEKSYAKDKIKKLAEYGIGFKGESFLPKDKIRQREYILLLWKATHQYNIGEASEDDIYDYFIKAGYMEESEKSPDSIVTKMEGVKYIIRILNLREVAELEGIYNDIFLDQVDIKENTKGYINLAYGLNIISGDSSKKINPEYRLTREDAANMIYNYLFR